MKVFITGISGQLGQALLLNKPEDIKVISPSHSELDLRDKTNCFKYIEKNKPDWLINCAAYTAVDKAEEEPSIAKAINAEATEYFAKAIKLTGGKMLQISTDFVFDGNQRNQYKPNQITNPKNIYGYTKVLGENAVKKILFQTNKGVILRTSWLMGPTGKNFLLTMLKLFSEDREISVVNDQFGSLTSTFTLSNLCWKVIDIYSSSTKDEIDLPSILHWSDLGVISWYEIALEIAELAYKLNIIKSKAKVLPISSKEYKTLAKRPKFSSLNCERSCKVLNVNQTYWKDSLFDILKYISGQERKASKQI